MIDAGARRKALQLAGSVVDDPRVSIISELSGGAARVAAAALLCGGLAACSAHERGVASSQTPATAEQAGVSVGASASADVVAAAPGQAQTVQTAAAAPAAAGPAGASQPVVAAAPAPVPAPAAVRTASTAKIGRSGGGLASWYGSRFHGRPTANGERFDMGGFTAAHRKFPLPSYVRVTNVSNGRSIVVRVNDRGPFHGNRVIDVSRRTADVLGFRHGGVGNVKLDLIGPAPESGSDDRRLLASYQEFGHPTAAPGQQLAMAPVSDQDLANESLGYGGRAYAVASAAVTKSAAFVTTSASAVVAKASDAASSATAAVGKALPTFSQAKKTQTPTQVAAAAPQPAGAPAAYAAPNPALASMPAAITGAPAQKPRVVAPAEPVLASAAPVSVAPAPVQTASVDVTSRIAAGFDSFDAFAPRLRSGADR